MKNRFFQHRLATIISVGLLTITFSPSFISSTPASAVSGSDWQVGKIIDDALFYDNSSMSTSQIQSFLNSKVPRCDTWGAQPASDQGYPSLTRAEYAQKAGWPAPPYICTRDYYQVPRSDKVIDNYNKTATRPSGSISAAQIIKRAADNYNVSPKVLLVLLQKESAGPLPIDTWPLQKQYRNAMGYACPDTAPCDPAYAGFYNQMMNAAKRIQAYKLYPNQYRHKPFAWNSVYYHPDLNRCGSSSVYIATRATAGLYNYTPYQPNKAALDNMYGTGDSCSAYGNRNFWRIYSDWFGPTYNRFTKLDQPRWMVTNKDTQKRDMTTFSPIDSTISEGRQIFFPEKLTTTDQTYLRTKNDTNIGANKAIPRSDVSEIAAVPFSAPRYLELNSARYKINPLTGYIYRNKQYPAGTVARFVEKISVNGETFYKTETDASLDANTYFRETATQELTYDPFVKPRYMRTTATANKIDPATGDVAATIAAGTDLEFSSKVYADNQWFYRTKQDTVADVTLAIPASSIKNIPFTTFSSPAKWLQLSRSTQKIDPLTGSLGPKISIETYPQIQIANIITVNNVSYYQTNTDAKRRTTLAIPTSSMAEIPFVPLDAPRKLTLNKDSTKTYPKTGAAASPVYRRGMTTTYSTKIYVNGTWYLRSTYDTTNKYEKGIPYSLLR